MGVEEVTVVGAGPSALLFAREMALTGLRPLLVEEHGEVGVPRHCSGLVSIRGLRLLELKDEGYVENEVSEAEFYSPKAKTVLRVGKSKPVAYVLDRESFDKYLYSIASSLGVPLRFNSRVTNVDTKGGLWRLSLNGREILRTRFLVNGEGAKYRIVKQLGLSPPRPSTVLSALQYDMRGVKGLDERVVEIYLGERWAPGFFAWIIPRGGDKARVGLASWFKPTYLYLKHFMLRHPVASKKLAGAKVEKLTGGRVILSGPRRRVWGTGFLLLGDAAGYTKPTTGGGVIIGGLCAIAAAGQLSKVLVGEERMENAIEGYYSFFKRTFLRDILYMKVLRRILWSLDDEGLEVALKRVKELGLEGELSLLGDMEGQGSAIRRLLKEPSLITELAPRLLRGVFGRLLLLIKGGC